MKDTCGVGNRTTAKVLSALLDRYELVLLPFGDGARYDLMVDEAGQVTRVQCKTGKLKDGYIVFRNYSVTKKGEKPYGMQVDAYGVYCPQNKKTYLVPVNDCSTKQTRLRITPTRNGQKSKIRFAEKYEV